MDYVKNEKFKFAFLKYLELAILGDSSSNMNAAIIQEKN